MTNERDNVLKRIIKKIRTLFIDGLLTLLPIVLTVAFLNFSFKLVKSWLIPIHIIKPKFMSAIPHSEIILVFLFVLFVGAFLKTFLLNRFLHYMEYLISSIPLVRPVYAGLKQLVSAFTTQEKVTFKKVVLVEFPLEKVYSVGFLTSEVPQDMAPNKQAGYYNIFVPTTPNPTTGFFVAVTQEKFQIVDLSRQEAMALIISGGIILPERFNIRSSATSTSPSSTL